MTEMTAGIWLVFAGGDTLHVPHAWIDGLDIVAGADTEDKVVWWGSDMHHTTCQTVRTLRLSIALDRVDVRWRDILEQRVAGGVMARWTHLFADGEMLVFPDGAVTPDGVNRRVSWDTRGRVLTFIV